MQTFFQPAVRTPGATRNYVRIVGHNAIVGLPRQNHKAGMFTISDNLIGSQEINVHLVTCRGVVATGNVIYSGHRRNLELAGSRNIVIGPNSFDHNPDYGDRELCTGVRLADSTDCTLSGAVLHDCQAGEHTLEAAGFVYHQLLEVDMFIDGPHGRLSEAVHILFAGEKVRQNDEHALPCLDEPPTRCRRLRLEPQGQ